MPKVRRELYSRPPMERMLRIHAALKTKEYPNFTRLSKELEISVRSLARDVDFMRERLKLPIEWDARRNGYYYSKPVEHFPMLPMSEAETFALLVAHKAVAQYHGTPFEKPLESAFRRLTGQLDQRESFSIAAADQVSFRPFAPDDLDWKNLEALQQGLQERRVLRFGYRNRGAPEWQEREVHPYHLGCFDSRWYLHAYDVKRKAVRTFALTRMKELVLRKGRFTVPKSFNLGEYLRGSFGVYKGEGKEDYEVVLEFDAFGADEVRGRRWHETQVLEELPKGMLRLRMRLNSLEEVARWVRSFEDHVVVAGPEELRRRMAELARNDLARYQEREIS